MTLETLNSHCSYLYNALYIPIYIIEDRKIIAAFPEQEIYCYPSDVILEHFFHDSEKLSFFTTSFSAGFGKVVIEDSEYMLIMGPQFAVPFSQQIYFEMGKEYSFSAKDKEQAYAFFHCIPMGSFLTFTQVLRMIYHFLNPGFSAEISYLLEETQIQKLRMAQYGRHYEMQEYGYHNNSIEVEQAICKIVEAGDISAYEQWIQNVPYVASGITSSLPLRQKKNIGIASITVISRAAIRGGMDAKEALLLSDQYVQDLEKSFTDQQIDGLMLDASSVYVHAVHAVRVEEPAGHSMEDVIRYVRKSLNQPMTVAGIAAHFGYNPDYLSHKFKAKLGFGLKAFIRRAKLEEAGRLLKYTDKSILEVSNYLCFPNQSSFQNAFKCQYGITPQKYRIREQEKYHTRREEHE